MVAVGAVLGGEFPVALVDVRAGTAQYLQAFWGLVDDHVDDLRRLAEVLDQRLDVGIQAAEQEATVRLETGDLGQVVGAVAVEAVGVAGIARVFDLEQLATVVESPAVERAGVAGTVAALVPAEHGAAVAAGIEEGIELPVLVARDEDRLAPHGQGEEVVLFGDLAFMGQVDPVALEDVLHLQVEQARVGEHLAFAAIDAGFTVVLKHGIEVVESQGHGQGLRCYCSDRVRLGVALGRQYPSRAECYPFCANIGAIAFIH